MAEETTIKKKKFSNVIFSVCLILLFTGHTKDNVFQKFIEDFAGNYLKLNIPGTQYDYREYFSTIPSVENIEYQEDFFNREKSALNRFQRAKLDISEQIIFDHLRFEIDFNLQRISLEKSWIRDGRKIPQSGLHDLPDVKSWYTLFIKKYTGLNLSPEEIMKLGLDEVKKVKYEIKKIQIESGYEDSMTFYNYLKSDSFYITDKQKLLAEFENTSATIRKKLNSIIGNVKLPEVFPIEWPGAGPNTPPGMYINHENNPYGKDVFQYNFYGGKYNSRAIEWLYMHEAIPGHHLQFSLRAADAADSLQNLFSYPGCFEGWACYVEYEGKKLGLYRSIYSYLGKWEWDLVRSARLVIDAGIHYYGWTTSQALDYWKENIPGQDEIADREISRVTNWPAQALSYKAGADCILNLKNEMMKKYGKRFNEIRFNRSYLSFGMRPPEVISRNFDIIYSAQ